VAYYTIIPPSSLSSSSYYYYYYYYHHHHHYRAHNALLLEKGPVDSSVYDVVVSAWSSSSKPEEAVALMQRMVKEVRY